MSCLNAGPSQEVFSFSFGGLSDNLLAAGCKSQVMVVVKQMFSFLRNCIELPVIALG